MDVLSNVLISHCKVVFCTTSHGILHTVLEIDASLLINTAPYCTKVAQLSRVVVSVMYAEGFDPAEMFLLTTFGDAHQSFATGQMLN